MKTVILTSFKSDVRAHMLQDLLKNEGIESMLQGEYTAQVLAYIPGMEIKVLVFEKDYARAFEILKDQFSRESISITFFYTIQTFSSISCYREYSNLN